MRKTFILFSMLMLVAFAAQAQRGGGQGQRQRLSPKEQATAQAETFQEELGLSDEQYEKTYAVLLASAETRQEKMQEAMSSGNRGGIREAFEEMQKDTDAKLKKIFSETQWTKYEEWKENRAQRGRRGGGQRADDRGDRGADRRDGNRRGF